VLRSDSCRAFFTWCSYLESRINTVLYSSKKLAQITQSYAPFGVKIGWLEKQEIYDGMKAGLRGRGVWWGRGLWGVEGAWWGVCCGGDGGQVWWCGEGEGDEGLIFGLGFVLGRRERRRSWLRFWMRLGAVSGWVWVESYGVEDVLDWQRKLAEAADCGDSFLREYVWGRESLNGVGSEGSLLRGNADSWQQLLRWVAPEALQLQHVREIHGHPGKMRL
jgi:hypothetical protein